MHEGVTDGSHPSVSSAVSHAHDGPLVSSLETDMVKHIHTLSRTIYHKLIVLMITACAVGISQNTEKTVVMDWLKSLHSCVLCA